MERAITTDASLIAAQDSDNIIRTQTMAMPNVDITQGMDTGGSPRRQETIRGAPAQTRSERVLKQPNEPPLPEGHTSGSGEGRMEHTFEFMDIISPTPHDSPLPGGYTPGSDEGRLKLEKLMAMCTKLLKHMLDLEKENDAQAVKSSDDDLDEEDASKKGRTSDKTRSMFKDSDFDDLDDLVDEGMAFVQEKDAENQGKIGADDTEVVKGSGDTEAINIAGEGVSTAALRTPPTITIARIDVDHELAARMTQEEQDNEVNYEPLSRKFPIMNWNIGLLGKMEEKDMLVQGSCGVHTLFMDGKPMEINMLVEKKYPLIKELLEKMLNLQLELKKKELGI
ncbi:hypothetical protein Tco_1195749 [Tanacetum coccineum]